MGRLLGGWLRRSVEKSLCETGKLGGVQMGGPKTSFPPRIILPQFRSTYNSGRPLTKNLLGTVGGSALTSLNLAQKFN
jgi:hypothetical protein